MLKALLQGKPLGHPLHPALVHLPIGLFAFSLILDLASFFSDDGNAFVQGAYYAMLIGVITALIAAIPGLADWSDIRADHPARKMATTHMALNILAVALYVVNLLLRSDERDVASTPVLPFVLSLAGVGILAYSGYMGGTLVYDDGIGVGRHRRETPTPRQTIVARREADGFVVIAPAASLAEGETLRANVDGTVMTIARINGECFAFQEFCTHRFGPLSEGQVMRGGEIECPWHRSRFDVRTGEVTQGPAKESLRTFELTVRDGAILVRPQRNNASEADTRPSPGSEPV